MSEVKCICTCARAHKIKNFQNFQKTGIYVVELAVFNQCAKFQLDTIIFDPQKGCFCLPHGAQQ